MTRKPSRKPKAKVKAKAPRPPAPTRTPGTRLDAGHALPPAPHVTRHHIPQDADSPAPPYPAESPHPVRLGIVCPRCSHHRFRTVYVRYRRGANVRTRECRRCGHRIRTVEQVQSLSHPGLPKVRQPFRRPA
jgi:Zn ribbon nucleic-acid-binding protein